MRLPSALALLATLLAALLAPPAALDPAWAQEAPRPEGPRPDAPRPDAPSADPTQVRPGAYVLDTDHAKITWSLNHLGYSTYYGQITDVTGTADLDPRDPARSRLSVRIGVDSIASLNPRLDAHLKGPDFFDTRNHPVATFVAAGVEPTSPTTARVTGDLTLRGVTRRIAFDATFNQAGIHPVDRRYTVGFDGRTVLKRSEFGVSGFLPVLGDEVTLRLEGEFKAAP